MPMSPRKFTAALVLLVVVLASVLTWRFVRAHPRPAPPRNADQFLRSTPADLHPGAPPPALQRELASAACGRPVLAGSMGELTCPVCPAESAEGGLAHNTRGWSYHSALLGHFTQASTQEAIVRIQGCEPHASDFGGDFLLRLQAGHWTPIRYISGGILDDTCQLLNWTAGRNALVCDHADMHQGVGEESVSLLTLEPQEQVPGTTGADFLSLTDDSSLCPGQHPQTFTQTSVDAVHLLPAAPDAPPNSKAQDVEIAVSIGQLSVPPSQGDCPAIPRRHFRIRFRNLGDHFEPDAQAAAAINALSATDVEQHVSARVTPALY